MGYHSEEERANATPQPTESKRTQRDAADDAVSVACFAHTHTLNSILRAAVNLNESEIVFQTCFRVGPAFRVDCLL